MTTKSIPWESLVSAREAAGMSRYRLAKEMGINLSHLGRLEKGLATPRADTIRRAADAIGVPVERVTPGDPLAAFTLTTEQLHALIIRSLKESYGDDYLRKNKEASPSLKLWGVYLNTDMTEGRGMRYLARLFRTEEKARAWVETQNDYPGHPMHIVQETELDLAALDSFEGMKVPR